MKRKYVWKFVFTLMLVLTFCFRAKDVQAAGGTVYVSVEKFTLGQGYLIEPIAVPFYDGENYAQVLDRVLKQAGYEYKNAGTLTDDSFYLSAIKNADSGLIDIPDCILNMEEYGITNESAQQRGNDDEWLSEFDYSQGAGWYYFVNNDAPQVGMSQMKATDGAVVRYQFTLVYGADLGNEESFAFTPLSLPNRDVATRNLAILKQYLNKNASAQAKKVYDDAIAVVSDMDSSEEQIAQASAAVAAQIDVLRKQEAQSKPQGGQPAENDQTANNQQSASNAQQITAQQELANARKYTPAKVKLKSAKKTGAKTVKLTWKKVKGCTGYEIYISRKKSSGYKKSANIKKWKKVTGIVKKGIKKKKTYYFNVRAYRKAAGKTYYGAFSNVKKVKMR